MKLIEIFVKIAYGMTVPKKIKTKDGQIWTYEETFGQYKNDELKELIKYLNGYYCKFETGLTYRGIFNYEVEVVEGE